MSVNMFKALLRVASVVGFVCAFSGCDDGSVTLPPPVTLTYNDNGSHAGVVPTDPNDYRSGDVVTVLDNTGNLVGAAVGGEHTGSGINQRFVGWSTASDSTIAEFVGGDTFVITENTTLYAILTTGTGVLRKVGPAGGWVFYDYGDDTQTWGRYLEAADREHWSNFNGVAYVDPTTEWGDHGNSVGGDATLTGIGQGLRATVAVVAHMNNRGITGTAAQLCNAYVLNDFDDWFLPSRDELHQIYVNLFLENSGGLSIAGFWSSSEAGNISARHQYFSSSSSTGQWSVVKESQQRVRAVRAF